MEKKKTSTSIEIVSTSEENVFNYFLLFVTTLMRITVCKSEKSNDEQEQS